MARRDPTTVQAWCDNQGFRPEIYDSIINKTPLSNRTNRIIGGSAPSSYFTKLETGGPETPPIPPGNLDDYIRPHLIDPSRLRADDFSGFMEATQRRLITMIEEATGQPISATLAGEKTEEVERDEATAEASLTIAVA